jgi:large subunit ribosomal protein L21
MYAIVKVGGKQYRVEKGDSLVVDRMPDKEGAKVSLQPLLYRSDKTVFEGADLGKVKVEAVVAGHERGKKIRVQKFKPKRGYKRIRGHRSELTRLEIKDIKLGAARAAAKPTAEKAPAAKAAAGKTTAAKSGSTTPARKPAARKPATGSRTTTTKKTTDGS